MPRACDDVAVTALVDALHLPGLGLPAAPCSRVHGHRGRQALPAAAIRSAARPGAVARAHRRGRAARASDRARARPFSSTVTTTSMAWPRRRCSPEPFARMGARVVPFVPRRLEDGYDLSDGRRQCRGRRWRARRGDGGLRHERRTPRSRRSMPQASTSSSATITCRAAHCPTAWPCSIRASQGAAYPDKDLAAAGVVFKLALALARRMGASEGPVFGLLDLVALATVADVAPLRGENRVFVRYGLRLLAETTNLGLRALVQRLRSGRQSDHRGACRLHPRAALECGWPDRRRRCGASSSSSRTTRRTRAVSRRSWTS